MLDSAATSRLPMPPRTGHAPAATAALLLPAALAVAVGGLLLLVGDRLLNDPDTLWQVAVGGWIVDHGTVPRADVFSATFKGAPWISTQWLAQVLLAQAHAALGWAGPVLLTALAAALALALLARLLLQRLHAVPALALTLGALMLAAPHLVARPHVLALPVLVAWGGVLVRAADRAAPPPLAAVLLMALWANLHGGFILGLALIAPLALDALLQAPAARRGRLAFAWIAFAAASVAAACATPYGVESMLAARRIVGLGDALSLIGEWQPQDFGRLAAFELCLLAGIGYALYRGLVLPPLRIVLLLGLLHMALAHARNGEVLGPLAPLLVAAPLAHALGGVSPPPAPSKRATVLVAAAAVLVLAGGGLLAAPALRYAPNGATSPAGAVHALKQHGVPGVVLNAYDFGGYLIAQGMAPFIDGRTELYGARFVVRHHRAVTLQDVPDLLRLLDAYRVGATLFRPSAPAVGLLDMLPGWRRLYADETAVVHVRAGADMAEAGAVRPDLLGLRR